MVDVSLVNISHSYDGGKTWAVQDINLEFESGKRYALLGPSGCGKTTLLKIICGLIKPSKGRVFFEDVDVTEYPPEKRNVAIVFQFPVVYKMTVLENLLFPLMNVKISKDEKINKAKEVASLLKLEGILKEPAHRLGPADRQRIAIGRALIRNAGIILLDEPMSSIEPDRKYEIKKLLIDISRSLKRTMIFVTHDQTEALTFGEKIAVMSPKGRLLQFGNFDEIYHKPSHEFVGFFIGFPGMNLIEAVLENNFLNFGSFKISIRKEIIPLKTGTRLKVGIRPEHVRVSTVQLESHIPFKVVYVEDLGRGKCILHLQNDSIIIKAISEKELPIHSTAWVKFPEDYLNFFDESGQRIM
ncbi:MAG: ABC transporter ATP-binding protein [Nitrososphaerota archaeon]